MVKLHRLWSLGGTSFAGSSCRGRQHTCGSSLHSHEKKKFDEFFFPPPAPSDGGARSSAGECAAAAAINLLTPQSIMGLSLVSAAGAAAQSAVNKLSSS